MIIKKRGKEHKKLYRKKEANLKRKLQKEPNAVTFHQAKQDQETGVGNST